MAVIIQRDNPTDVSPLIPPRKHNILDTILLYAVGFVGLIGSIYLLHISNTSKVNPFEKDATPNTLYSSQKHLLVPGKDASSIIYPLDAKPQPKTTGDNIQIVD